MTPALLTTALALGPSAGWCCGAPQSGLTGTQPAEGETWPANAAIELGGYEVSIAELVVTVDGAPAALRPGDLPGLSAFVQPTPTVGAEVVVDGPPCPSCAPMHLRYLAGPTDDAAPDEPAAPWFDIYDHADVQGDDGLCQPAAEVTYYLHPAAPVEPAEGAPERLRVEYRLGDDRWEPLYSAAFPEPAGAAIPWLIELATLQGQTLAGGVCFRASVYDAAGNQSAPSEPTCTPCRLRVDDSGAAFDAPQWSADDLYPEGVCPADLQAADEPAPDARRPTDAGVGPQPDAPANGGDDGGGCSTTSAGGSGPSAAWALMGLLAASLLRRRRQRIRTGMGWARASTPRRP